MSATEWVRRTWMVSLVRKGYFIKDVFRLVERTPHGSITLAMTAHHAPGSEAMLNVSISDQRHCSSALNAYRSSTCTLSESQVMSLVHDCTKPDVIIVDSVFTSSVHRNLREETSHMTLRWSYEGHNLELTDETWPWLTFRVPDAAIFELLTHGPTRIDIAVAQLTKWYRKRFRGWRYPG